MFGEVGNEIRQICVEELPDYEVPSYIEQIDKVLYTQNEKEIFGTCFAFG